MTIKTRILAGLACICLILTIFFWPGKEEEAYSSDVIKEAEDVTTAETEMMAPDESLESPNGTVRLQALYNEKPVCLFFWSSWSQDSLRQLAALEEVYPTYGQAIQFVTVPVGPDQEDSLSYMKQRGAGLPVYCVREPMLKEYGVHDIPKLIFIARGGQMTRPFDSVLTPRQLSYEMEKLLK